MTTIVYHGWHTISVLGENQIETNFAAFFVFFVMRKRQSSKNIEATNLYKLVSGNRKYQANSFEGKTMVTSNIDATNWYKLVASNRRYQVNRFEGKAIAAS